MKQLNLRVPDDVHERVKAAADASRRSMNAQILWMLEQQLGKEDER